MKETVSIAVSALVSSVTLVSSVILAPERSAAVTASGVAASSRRNLLRSRSRWAPLLYGR